MLKNSSPSKKNPPRENTNSSDGQHSSALPPYSEPPAADANGKQHLGPGVRTLNLDLPTDQSSKQSAEITLDECIAHLKLLAAFADLRDTISQSDGLFGLEDANFVDPNTPKDQRDALIALVREKRWAIYVARAVSRFEAWFLDVLQEGPGSCQGRITIRDIEENSGWEHFPSWSKRISWTADSLPPLDVLMVWHAYMLNPRCFLEDCLRFGKMSFWASGMPWAVLNASIDNHTFDYAPGREARSNFEQKTSLSWESLYDPIYKIISCPGCGTPQEASWVGDVTRIGTIEMPFKYCKGYADHNFQLSCGKCRLVFSHENLHAAKFLRDMKELSDFNIPMPGTVLSMEGVPKRPENESHSFLFPNKLILNALHQQLLRTLDFRLHPHATMKDVRSLIETAIGSRRTISQANRSISGRLILEEKVSVRRMMSRYWDNSSPFALDLIGAVIRQGVFIDKMDNIDWIHSPALDATMSRLIQKYKVFFRIMADNPGKVAVPTLDVDLAWHTHQLSPQRYFVYSVKTTKGRFVNHDDKIDQHRLSDGFGWTSKMYQKYTGGEIYSECTCWYCEAVRQSNGTNSLFSSARSNAIALHNQPDITSDPTKNPHISAHNSVFPRGDPRQHITFLKLQRDHERAKRRWGKRNRSKDKGKNGTTSNGPYSTTAMVYGCPIVVPFYLPYAPDPSGIAWRTHAEPSQRREVLVKEALVADAGVPEAAREAELAEAAEAEAETEAAEEGVVEVLRAGFSSHYIFSRNCTIVNFGTRNVKCPALWARASKMTIVTIVVN
ncbi:hypothetical protein LOZ65_002392 [Ophidiomyces ophidiicola]|nr:hypothetical protein LOZ65_002392 [Ophidiomyces ophidiicola]